MTPPVPSSSSLCRRVFAQLTPDLRARWDEITFDRVSYPRGYTSDRH
jgi:hypothetical protein